MKKGTFLKAFSLLIVALCVAAIILFKITAQCPWPTGTLIYALLGWTAIVHASNLVD